MDSLIDELWDTKAPKSARGNLKTYVWLLRSLLAQTDPGASPIRSDSRGYMFQAAPGDVDMFTFEQLIAEGRAAQHRGDFADAGQRLDRALALWRGPALEGVPIVGSRLVQVVRRLEEQRLTAFEDLTEVRLATGGHRDVIANLRIWVERHPLHERLWGQLMLALFRDGRQAEALHTYQLLWRRLVDEVGVEPGEALQLLHGQILAGDSALTAPADRVAPVVGATTESGPEPVPDLLPPDASDFTGRRKTVRSLENLLLGEPHWGIAPRQLCSGTW
ncbi:AfsR/SARP family transcriptional regulator [Dactylosporangium darangshiense]|uniref:Bacterial transcriptional activator domain-containing protein n=1 Tax=Dactylosporangium darangshiense TaxID=579108 RepID=A0ABP8DWS9_9ACTN